MIISDYLDVFMNLVVQATQMLWKNSLTLSVLNSVSLPLAVYKLMQNTCSLFGYCNSSPNMLTALNIYAHLLKLDLAKKCMIVEELIMAEEQTKS